MLFNRRNGIFIFEELWVNSKSSLRLSHAKTMCSVFACEVLSAQSNSSLSSFSPTEKENNMKSMHNLEQTVACSDSIFRLCYIKYSTSSNIRTGWTQFFAEQFGYALDSDNREWKLYLLIFFAMKFMAITQNSHSVLPRNATWKALKVFLETTSYWCPILLTFQFHLFSWRFHHS